MGEDMVDDKPEDDAAEAKVAGGDSSQQKCNCGALDLGNLQDGYGRLLDRSTMSTSP